MHGLLLRERDTFVEREHGDSDVFDRLALFIYGIRLSEAWRTLPPRRDGILLGKDFLLWSSELGDDADDDARRIAVVDSRLSPYWLREDGAVMLGDIRTGLRLGPFPYKTYLGPPFSYYLRSDRSRRYTRLVVNPHANCYSRCAWCARTYDSQSRPERIVPDDRTGMKFDPQSLRTLPRQVMPADELMEWVLRDPVVSPAGDLRDLTEIAVLSGDFPPNVAVVPYLVELLGRAQRAGFQGHFYYAGHQLEEHDEMAAIRETGVPTLFVYTIEHFTRRLELMPIKGRRTLPDIARILRCAGDVFGRENIFYYLIIGIDGLRDLRANLVRFKPLATPQAFVLTPYNFAHLDLYTEDSQLGRLRLVIAARRLMLDVFGRPIPGGSNRSLFALTTGGSGDPSRRKGGVAEVAPAS